MNCHPSKPCPQAGTCAHLKTNVGHRIDGTKALINAVCFLFVHKRHPAVLQKAAA
jgi:hypothetical protein